MREDFISSKWFIFILALLTNLFIAGAERLCIPVLFEEISQDLGLNLFTMGAIWGIDPLAGFFISIPAGLFLDRFNIKRMAIAICVLSGIFGALRGISEGFTSMALFTFAFGIVAAMTTSLGPKITAVWFSGKYLVLTNALLLVSKYFGRIIGTMLSATVFSPLLGGWRNVLFMYGAVAVVIGIFWFVADRFSNNSESKSSKITVLEYRHLLSHVIRNRKIWFISLGIMCVLGTMMAVNGYLPVYLRTIGWSSTSADSALTIMIAATCIGSIPLMLMSNKIRKSRFILNISILLISLSLILLSFIKGPLLWLIIALFGLVQSIPPVLFIVLLIETEGVGSMYAGTAIGLANTIGLFGSFIFPPLGNSFASISPGLPFIFWAIFCVLCFIMLLLTKVHIYKSD